ncbi:MAG: hypothetical protein ACHQU8_09545 [Gemmatimonadales bacterium]
MPTLTRWFLRAAIVNLVAALALALLMALPAFAGSAAAWRPVSIHLLVMGWATQMIFGVALWMFPRKKPLDLKSIDWLGWGCFVFTNLGLAVRARAEPALQAGWWALAGTGVQVAAVLQLAAVVAFVVQVWPRVTTR